MLHRTAISSLRSLTCSTMLAQVGLLFACSGADVAEQYDTEEGNEAAQTTSALATPKLVAHTELYGGIWERSSEQREITSRQTRSEFAAEYSRKWRQRKRLKSMTAHVVDGQPRYGGVWLPGNGGQVLRLSRTRNDFLADHAEWTDKGFVLTELSTQVENGKTVYSGIWNPGSQDQVLKLDLTKEAFLSEYSVQWRANRRLISLTSDLVAGSPVFHGVWVPATHGQYLGLNRTQAAFKRETARRHDEGFQLVAADSYTRNGKVYYSAIWNAGHGNTDFAIRKSRAEFEKTNAEMERSGLRLKMMLDDRVEALDLTLYGEDMTYHFGDNTVGFAATSGKGSTFHSVTRGLKRTGADGRARAFSFHTRLNMASVSKTITAVAMRRTLLSQGVGLDAAIAAYLPGSWIVGSNADTITFRELLTHRSGIRQSNPNQFTYADAKGFIESGISLDNKTRSYQNVNYALCRVLIALMNGLNENSRNMPIATGNAFLDYANTSVFSAAGLRSVALKPPRQDPPLFYPFPAGNVSGASFGDFTDRSGAAGFQLSSLDLAKFLVAYEEGKVLPTEFVGEMRSEMLGWNRSTHTKHGGAVSHGGFLHNGRGAELNTIAVSFATGVQLGVVVNSATNGVNILRKVTEGYDRSWIPVN